MLPQNGAKVSPSNCCKIIAVLIHQLIQQQIIIKLFNSKNRTVVYKVVG